MKKTLFGALLLSALTMSAQAQISAGTKLLTGSIGYNQYKSESDAPVPGNRTLEYKRSQFNFNPSIGYFVADNLALGVTAGVVASKSKGGSYYATPIDPVFVESESNGRVLSAGLFGRYYKFVGEKIALYGQVGGGYQNVYNANDRFNGVPNNNGNRQQGLYANLLPGIVFFPTDKLGLELTLRGAGYNRVTEKNEYGSTTVKNTTSNFDFAFGLNDLNLGISLYLGRN